jgi:murein DD-endopeptidase MepM/ murein hydrolase activator NlpD
LTFSLNKYRGTAANLRRAADGLSDYVTHFFPERQILVRAQGRVKFLTLSRPLQVSLLILSIGFVCWVVHSSTAYFRYGSILAGKDAEVERLRAAQASIIRDKDAALERSHAAYKALQVRAKEQSRRYLSVARQLEGSERRILDVLTQKAALGSELRKRETELERAKQAYARSVASGNALARNLRQVEYELESIALRNATLLEEVTLTQVQLDFVEQRHVKAVAERERLEQQLVAAHAEIDELADARAALSQRQDELKSALDKVVVERDEVTSQRSFLEGLVNDLKRRHAGLKEVQRELIAGFTERTVGINAEAEKALAFTGLDVDALLAALRGTSEKDGQPTGEGGPFVAYMPKVMESSHDLDHMSEIEGMLATLDDHVERWEGLRQLLRRLPLSPPVDQYRMTSKFGKRRDPINGKYGMHYGVDLSCRLKTPVLATAPGKVTFIGRKGTLGKTIEIDHGLGIRTRYSHLRNILVKRGQKVEFRQKIGLVGTTGRSTGPHVHYEVVVRSKPNDPLKFIKAGKYVFKG